MRITLLSLVAGAVLAQSLEDTTVARALEFRLSSADMSFMLLGVEDGRLIAARWPDPQRPIPLGSLIKPFTALAYGERHGYRYPRFTCRGEQDGCRSPRGHGQIGLEEALAWSCNAWFEQLAKRTEPEDVVAVLGRLGVTARPADGLPGTLIGRGEAWRISPLEMARAYCELASRRSDPATKPLLRGLASSARWGTASGLGTPALAKTGTAQCSHAARGAGDGFVLALYPPEAPRYALLLRAHGVPGAQAAVRAGRALRREGTEP